jgi:hypothetical protein
MQGSARDGASSATPSARGASEFRIDIGELVLDGFGPLDAERVRDSFHVELTRLVRERGVPFAVDADRAVDFLSGLPELPATSNPRRLGEALARAVHAGLSGGGAADRRGRRR